MQVFICNYASYKILGVCYNRSKWIIFKANNNKDYTLGEHDINFFSDVVDLIVDSRTGATTASSTNINIQEKQSKIDAILKFFI